MWYIHLTLYIFYQNSNAKLCISTKNEDEIQKDKLDSNWAYQSNGHMKKLLCFKAKTVYMRCFHAVKCIHQKILFSSYQKLTKNTTYSQCNEKENVIFETIDKILLTTIIPMTW